MKRVLQYCMQRVLQYVTCSAVRYAACSAVNHKFRSTVCSMFCSKSQVTQYGMQHVLQYVTSSAVRYAACSAVLYAICFPLHYRMKAQTRRTETNGLFYQDGSLTRKKQHARPCQMLRTYCIRTAQCCALRSNKHSQARFHQQRFCSSYTHCGYNDVVSWRATELILQL
jgi:hypothetical protein